MKYAIIQTGGKQYKVKAGDTIKIEKIKADVNQDIEFSDVLMIFDEADPEQVLIGKPFIEKVKVKAKVVGQEKGKKVVVVKYKPKVRYKKKTGHRQLFTKMKINEIVA